MAHLNNARFLHQARQPHAAAPRSPVAAAFDARRGGSTKRPEATSVSARHTDQAPESALRGAAKLSVHMRVGRTLSWMSPPKAPIPMMPTPSSHMPGWIRAPSAEKEGEAQRRRAGFCLLPRLAKVPRGPCLPLRVDVPDRPTVFFQGDGDPDPVHFVAGRCRSTRLPAESSERLSPPQLLRRASRE